jgi:hypothetical protein
MEGVAMSRTDTAQEIAAYLAGSVDLRNLGVIWSVLPARLPVPDALRSGANPHDRQP